MRTRVDSQGNQEAGGKSGGEHPVYDSTRIAPQRRIHYPPLTNRPVSGITMTQFVGIEPQILSIDRLDPLTPMEP